MDRRDFLKIGVGGAATTVFVPFPFAIRELESLETILQDTLYDPPNLKKIALVIAKKHDLALDGIVVSEAPATKKNTVPSYGGFYRAFFSEIRKHPEEKQELIVKEFYRIFHNGQALGDFIFSLFKIAWFKPERSYTERELKPYIDEIGNLFRLGTLEAQLGAYPVIAGQAWVNALKEAKAEIWNEAWKSGRPYSFYAARDGGEYAVLSGVNKPRWILSREWGTDYDGLVEVAGRQAAFIIASDLPLLRKKYPKNPFEPLMNIYKLGLIPNGLSLDGPSIFRVLHPIPKDFNVKDFYKNLGIVDQ